MNTQYQTDLAKTFDEIVVINREKSILVLMYELSSDQYDAIRELIEVDTDDDDGRRREYFHHCLVVKRDEVPQEELKAMNAILGSHDGVRYYGLQMSFID